MQQPPQSPKSGKISRETSNSMETVNLLLIFKSLVFKFVCGYVTTPLMGADFCKTRYGRGLLKNPL